MIPGLNSFFPQDEHTPIILPIIPPEKSVEMEWHEDLLVLKYNGYNLGIDIEINKLQIAVDVIAWAIKSGVPLEKLREVHKELTNECS